MSGKRSAQLAGLELELEEELETRCGPSKCEVCFVPIGSSEAAARHYGGENTREESVPVEGAVAAPEEN